MLVNFLQVAKKLGIRCQAGPRTPRHPYVWDGKTLRYWGLSRSNIIHEIGHWIVARPDERCLPEWGLGNSIEGLVTAPSILSPKMELTREQAASVVGICVEHALGLPIEPTAREHGWAPVHPQTEFRVFARPYTNKNGYPEVLKGIIPERQDKDPIFTKLWKT